LYFLKYKIENSEEFLTVATTRPETIFGDVAICINPNDEKYSHLKGKKVIVPIVNRVIPIIEDDYVDIEFGTGALKITPAHDINDYEIGQKFNLPIIDSLDDDANLNEHGLHYQRKDSLIEHVFGGVNPQGCEVTSFKTPSTKEYGHDFLWRNYQALPEKGKIGIFNRSHYESVLVCKVHPEYNLSEKVWDNVEQINDKFWKNRYESIRDFEKHLARNGTKIVKIFLHVSPEEQKQRFLDRINEEDKNWKFSAADLKERARFGDYMEAYEEAINETSKEHAPWFVVPADKKWFARLTALQIIIDALEDMNLKYPELPENEKTALEEAKKQLENEK
jgi:PPK2 family polyphosphate:nucleotide phosphotransferase